MQLDLGITAATEMAVLMLREVAKLHDTACYAALVPVLCILLAQCCAVLVRLIISGHMQPSLIPQSWVLPPFLVLSAHIYGLQCSINHSIYSPYSRHFAQHQQDKSPVFT